MTSSTLHSTGIMNPIPKGFPITRLEMASDKSDVLISMPYNNYSEVLPQSPSTYKIMVPLHTCLSFQNKGMDVMSHHKLSQWAPFKIDACPLCSMNFTDAERVVILKCFHYFHEDCYYKKYRSQETICCIDCLFHYP